MIRPLLAALCLSALSAPPAFALQAFEVSGYVNLDLAASAEGGRVYELDKTHIDVDADLEEALGWQGVSARVSLLHASGDLPNLTFGTLQGFDNIEVPDRRLRVYEAWLDKESDGGRASVRVGLYDLNSEFYVTPASGVFFAPAYGIGSELAATGSGGPSIYPSTALAVRAQFRPTKASYLRAAVLNAKAGTIGERGGVDTDFDEGVLTVAEAGWDGRGLIALGAWSYSRRRPDLFDPALLRRSAGAYVLLERPLRADDDGPAWTGFLRAGLSEGDTGPFEGSWQAGLVGERLLAGRPDGVIAIGVSGGQLGPAFRAASAGAGTPLAGSERQLEITYADRLGERVWIQPNLQVVADPGGDPAADTLVLLTVRLTVAF